MRMYKAKLVGHAQQVTLRYAAEPGRFQLKPRIRPFFLRVRQKCKLAQLSSKVIVSKRLLPRSLQCDWSAALRFARKPLVCTQGID